MHFKKFKIGKSPESFDSILGQTLKIEGDLYISNSVRIDGTVNGNITQKADSQATVAIADGAIVNGNIFATNVIISGEVRGVIICTERIELLSTALIHGDIRYNSIALEVGARICGTLNQLEAPSSPAPCTKTESKLND